MSTDRQTLKMNDFLKQIETYSNEKLDKFLSGSQNINNQHLLLIKAAEQLQPVLDRELGNMRTQRRENLETGPDSPAQ
jgi:hypothetical protein